MRIAMMVKHAIAAERADGVAEILEKDVELGKAARFALLVFQPAERHQNGRGHGGGLLLETCRC